MSHTERSISPIGSLKLDVPSASTVSTLKELNARRSSVKGRITKYKNLFNKISETQPTLQVDLCMLNQRYESLREMFSKFDELQTQIEIMNTANLEAELDIRDDIETDFSSLIAKTQLFLEANQTQREDFRPANSEICSNCSNPSQHISGFKLPTIKIANFDGTYFKWLEFRDTFTSLIHSNNRIESVHKFHYLNSYLEGEAAHVISNLEVSSANYDEAWKLLCERYNNEKQLISNHLNSLCNLQPVSRDSSKDLKFLIDHISKNLRALNTLGEPTASWDTLVIHLVTSKLDSSTNFKWEEHRSNFKRSPSLKDFFCFLKARANILESIQLNRTERASINKRPLNSFDLSKGQRPQTRSFVISAGQSSSSSTSICVLCGGDHRLYDCATFLAKSIADRTAEVVRLRLCFNCLRKGHSVQQCRLGPCYICKLFHNTLLHRDNSQAANISNVQAQSSTTEAGSEGEQATCNSAVSMSVGSKSNVLLSTAMVEIYNPNTRHHVTARALLDSGSQSSIITENLKLKLQLSSLPTKLNIIGIGNQNTCLKSLNRCNIMLASKCNDYNIETSCLVLPQITTNLPNKTVDISEIQLPSHLKLADPKFNYSAPIDLLIGADIFWTLIEPRQISLGTNKPVMHKSKLGWILSGPISTSQNNHKNSIHCNYAFIQSRESRVSNRSLNEQLAKFWEIEQVPQYDSLKTEEEIECENHYVANTYRNDEGRFCVRLPLVSEPTCLGDSFTLARNQFLSLERRLSKNSDLKNLYSQFIHEYSVLGHLSESEILIPRQSYFIPHHAVLKPSSESTKLRVVFNGSARTTSGFSINDLLMVGPNIQDKLFNILLRFRQYTYVISADIEKMYRQVQIQNNDRDLQMILWRDTSTEALRSLRLNTVTYGLSSSSFLSTRCLWQLGEDSCEPKIKNIIQNDFLVDDMLTGSDSETELHYIKKTVESTLAAGCFNLRKYRSNIPSLLIEPQSVQRELIISSSSHTLGIGWNPNEDYISFPSNYKITKNIPTKRSILSDSCKVFDPLGLLSLFTIKPKIILQRLWLTKIDWDEPVPADISRAWQSFLCSVSEIQHLRIPRHVLCPESINTELHCFCDASQSAYAACIYLRSHDAQGNVRVRLLCSKARVASVNPMTIPRLELCACVLGAQLVSAVCRALRCAISHKIFWTDSSIVLTWLSMRCDRLKTFVANRVGTILESTDISEWRHVPTSCNPADLASRGLDVSAPPQMDLWWNGPKFLKESKNEWPALFNHRHPTDDLPEIKINLVNTSKNMIQTLIHFDRYSNLRILQRACAYILRFVLNCRNKPNKKNGILQPDELINSFETLVRLAQKDSFSTELATIDNKGVLSPNNPLISLSPFIDDKGILRVGGRLNYSCQIYDKRHPMLLHAKHKLTKLLFQQEHLRLLHAAPQLLLSTVREFVWPIAGRDLARATVRQCIVCRRASAKMLAPMMGALPSQRVDPDFPFISAGIDFCGPFLITDRKGRGCKISKCYMCVFVCLRYKCLHLEAVSDLTKEAFILSLRRFISRRGKPKEIFCDNGRNFVSASKEITEFVNSHADGVGGFLSSEGIDFKFQPAYAPHFGGLWEASVKSAKFHLKRILDNTHCTFEELATLFNQIEAILNSRPLCPLSSSPDDLAPLTPGHFLIGRPLTSLPSPNYMQLSTSRLNRYQHLEQIRQHFWNRWQLEYLNELQQRHKWRVPARSIQNGDLVLLKDENIPPMQWRTGRVINLFPGKDNIVRVAEIKTSTGVYRRGLRYLCPLLDTAEDSSLEANASKAPEDVKDL